MSSPSKNEIYNLLTYFELKESTKTGNFYRNTIFIQDTLVFKLQKDRELTQISGLYFSYRYLIPVLSNNISVSSNHHIIRNEISDKGYDNIILSSGDSMIMKGKLKKIEHIGDYSIITILDENTETSIKVKEYNIKRELNLTKDIELTILLPEKIINNNVTINIIYSLDLNQCNIDNDFWSFHHYLYINNNFENTIAYGTMIYESKDEIDDFKLISKIFIKPVCIGEKSIQFNKINFIDKHINKQSSSRSTKELTLAPPPNKMVVEEDEESLSSPHGIISSSIIETITGNIILSSGMETSYLIKSDKFKGKILNIIDIDVSSIIEDSVIPLRPTTIIIFKVNYLMKGDMIGRLGKNTIPHIPQGKLTIYGLDEMLTGPSTDIIITPETDKINLGESSIIDISYNLLRNETNFNNNNSNVKIIRLKISNISHLPTRTNINFTHVDFIIIIQSTTLSEERFKEGESDEPRPEIPEFDFNTIPDILKDKYKMIFKSKENQNSILLDFIIQPNSEEYVIMYIRLK
jgi:hypothetical protein